jgi:predicted RNase H-like HicB family nuclease
MNDNNGLQTATTEQTITLAQDANGVWFAQMNHHPGCHTQGATIPEVLTRLAEAYQLWANE